MRGGVGLYDELARGLYLGAALVVLLWLLYQVQLVVVVFLLAVILALAVNAPVTWLEGRGMRRGVATLLVLMGILAGLAGVSWLIVPRLIAEIPGFLDEVPELISRIADRFAGLLGDHPEIERQLLAAAQWSLQLLGGLWQHADAVAGVLVLTLFVLGLVIFMVLDPRPILETYLRALPPRMREKGTRAFTRGSAMVVGWVYSNIILGSIKAASVLIFLMLMGVPAAPLWSVLAFFAALVPRVGVYIMTIPPALLALTIDLRTALWVVLFFWLLSEILGNFIAPRIYGSTMDLHPVYLLLSTLVFAFAFGVVGVLIAPPIAGFVKAYFDEFYLLERPAHPHSERVVEAMLHRSLSGIEHDADAPGPGP